MSLTSAAPIGARAIRVTDIVVVGAPRSGTSLVAQLLASAGVGFGAHLLPASPANPRGFFEDTRVTDLNDELLAPHVVGRGALSVPASRLAWLGAPDDGATVTADAGQRQRMAALLPAPAPTGIKDPRLVWTLGAWRTVLPSASAFVGVVRHPAEVAASLRSMWESDRGYYGDLEVTVARGLRLWEAANHRLAGLVRHGRWLVVDHASLLGGDGVAALAGFTGLALDPTGVDLSLRRSGRSTTVAPASLDLYERLRDRAREDAATWGDP